MKKIFLLLIIGVSLLGCTQSVDNNTTDDNTNQDDINSGDDSLTEVFVENGDTIKVEYVGKFPDSGEVFDKSEGRGPLEFTAGAGQMIKGFDAAVIGMKLNEEKTVTISPEDAYGTADSGQRMEVPVAQISGGTDLNVGAKLSTSSGQQGTVVEINDGVAIIEFTAPINPMAGKTLEFSIKIVAMNKA